LERALIIAILLLITLSFGQEKVIIESDKLEREKDNIVIAEGNVVITSGDKVLKSEKVIYDSEKKIATVPVKFYIKTNTFEGIGSHGWYDFENDSGEVFDYQGKVDNQYYVRGYYLKKEKDVYYFKDGEFSGCPFDQYDWNFKAKSGSLKENDQLKAYNMSFRFCRLPIFYTPYFSYPTTDRKTGFLDPMIGQDTYNPFVYRQPFFYVINDSSDITFTTDYRNKQGFGTSLEYRRVFERGMNFRTNIDLFKESGKKDWWQNRPESPKTFRYRFSLETNYSPFYNWQFFTKVDIPSDRYFFEDFYNYSRLKYTAFTRSYIFGRTNTDKYLLELNFNYLYDLTTPNNKATLQRLPQLRFYWKESKLFDLPFYFDYLSDNNYFFREEGTTGLRSDNILRVINYNYFGKILNTFEATPRLTLYLNTKGNNTFDSRFLLPFKNTTQTTFFRPYKDFNHIIIPKISFEYISKINQSSLPYYDRSDRINEKEDVDFSIFNILNFKNNNFLRWEISQGYTFLNHYYIGENIYNSHIKPLKNSIYLNIGKYSADSVLYYDTEKKNLIRTISSFSAPIRDNIIYSVAYTYDRGTSTEDSQKQISNSIFVNYKNYSFRASILNNLKYGYVQNKSLAFDWNRGCWSLSFSYWEDYNITTQKRYKNIFIIINILDMRYRVPFVRN
jgi:LPS-assembly protein